MKNYLQKQAAKSLFVHCRKRKVSVSTLRMSVTVRQSSSFHILTSFAQVDADSDIREDIISLLLLGNDIASDEMLVSRHYTYRHHSFKFNFAPRSPSRRNVRDLVNQSHNKKLGRLRMQAVTQTADDGMYVITRGCSQISRVPQKINNIV